MTENSRKIEEEEKIFNCSVCGLEEKFDYFGRTPPFAKPIEFSEDVYVMKDPFNPKSRKIPTNYLLLGGSCSVCKNSVCSDSQTCSIFYVRRFCRQCAIDKQKSFPQDIQNDIVKLENSDPDLTKST